MEINRRSFLASTAAVTAMFAGCSTSSSQPESETSTTTPTNTEATESTDDTDTSDRTTEQGNGTTSTSSSDDELSYEGTYFAWKKETGMGWQPIDGATFTGEHDTIGLIMGNVGPLETNDSGHYEVGIKTEVYDGDELVYEDDQTPTVKREFSEDIIPGVQFAVDATELDAGSYSIKATFTDRVVEASITAKDRFTIE